MSDTLTQLQRLQDAIRQQHWQPVYFFYGEEGFFFDYFENLIVDQALPPDQRAFNLSVLQGAETTIDALLAHVMQYPFQAEHRVVVLRNAQECASLKDLLLYLDRPVASTILIIQYRRPKLDMRSQLGKRLAQTPYLIALPKLNEGELRRWLEHYIQARGRTISPEALQLITQGNIQELAAIVQELDKTLLHVERGQCIDLEAVYTYTSIDRHYNIFELVDAISNVQTHKALRIVQYYDERDALDAGFYFQALALLYRQFTMISILHQRKGSHPQMLSKTLGVPAFVVQKLSKSARAYPPTAMREVFRLLYRYDLKAKGVDNWKMPLAALLRELVLHLTTVAIRHRTTKKASLL